MILKAIESIRDNLRQSGKFVYADEIRYTLGWMGFSIKDGTVRGESMPDIDLIKREAAQKRDNIMRERTVLVNRAKKLETEGVTLSKLIALLVHIQCELLYGKGKHHGITPS